MYTIIFRKGNIELELTTDDKMAVERQLDLIINQANSHLANKKNNENNIPKFEDVINNKPQEIQPENNVQQNTETIEPINNNEPLNVQPAVFEHITESEKQAIIQPQNDIVPQTIDIASVKPVTINSIQNPEPTPEPDFDKILNNEIEHKTDETPILKDEKFIEYVEGKAAIEKIDFLVIAAQYLAQYENMNTFNLKHINAKLMQNFTIIVDHTVLQSAIAKDLITRIHEGGDDVSSEYMLTEKGLRSY